MKCPICKSPVTPQNPDLPFCGERCRTIDLGNWATGKYVVSSPISDPLSNPVPPASEEDD